MKLPSVKNLKVAGKKVLLRTDYDIPASGDTTRIEKSLSTINYLLGRKARVIIISHLGRPGGKVVTELSLGSAAQKLGEFLKRKITLVNQVDQVNRVNQDIVLLENLRFYPGEEANPSTGSGQAFAKKLASLADFYVNEAFACSHRKHASIVGVPKFFPTSRRALGLNFLKEIEVLSKIREKPCRPVALILGGVKKDKIEFAKKLVFWADWILVGGKLVEYDGVPELINHPKIVGSLIKNGQDITMEAVEKFKKVIAKAKTVVWSGPVGNFYEERYALGTKKIAEAIVKSGAFSVAGGGDTEAALTKFGLNEKIGFISSGGGAMLEFLAKGTLPGIEAIKNG